MRGKKFVYYNPIFHLLLALNIKSDTTYIFQIFYKKDRHVLSLRTHLSVSSVKSAPLPREPCRRTEAFWWVGKKIESPFLPALWLQCLRKSKALKPTVALRTCQKGKEILREDCYEAFETFFSKCCLLFIDCLINFILC